MENDEQYYTFRLWKWSNRGLCVFMYDQFQDACCWEKKIPQNSISLLSVFVFPTVNVFLEGDRAGSWWKPFIFLDEAGFNLAMTCRRGWEPSGWERPRIMFSGGPNHPPLNVILRGPTAKLVQRAQNSQRQHWDQSWFHVHPQFITLYLPPYSPFLTVTRLRSFSPHGGGGFTIGSSQTSLSSPGHRWFLQWHHRRPMSGLFLTCRKIFPQEV